MNNELLPCPQLKPCPFCGGVAREIRGLRWQGWREVGCYNANCEVRPNVHYSQDHDGGDRDLENIWNTRQQQASNDVQVLRDALKAAMPHIGWVCSAKQVVAAVIKQCEEALAAVPAPKPAKLLEWEVIAVYDGEVVAAFGYKGFAQEYIETFGSGDICKYSLRQKQYVGGADV